jgi:alkaline phosphatase D
VSFSAGPGRAGRDAPVEGSFKTPPAAQTASAVTLAWGGDLAGQNVCRDAVEGFPVFASLVNRPLDFFVGLGDMIYADNLCEPVGRYGNTQVPGAFLQAANMADFWAHWKYNREDERFQALLRSHAILRHLGRPRGRQRLRPAARHPQRRRRTRRACTLLPMGLAAFLDYNPVAENAGHAQARSIAPSAGAGTSSCSSSTPASTATPTSPPTAPQRPKTMLGREQLVMAERQRLAASDATWKVDGLERADVHPDRLRRPPLGRDGWAELSTRTRDSSRS